MNSSVNSLPDTIYLFLRLLFRDVEFSGNARDKNLWTEFVTCSTCLIGHRKVRAKQIEKPTKKCLFPKSKFVVDWYKIDEVWVKAYNFEILTGLVPDWLTRVSVDSIRFLRIFTSRCRLGETVFNYPSKPFEENVKQIWWLEELTLLGAGTAGCGRPG